MLAAIEVPRFTSKGVLRMKTRVTITGTCLFAMYLLLSSGLMGGCATATAPTPPTAPGYANQTDQQMGATLRAADGYYKTVQCETQGKNWKFGVGCVSDPNITSPMVLSVAEQTAMNDLMTALNLANAAYTGYHAGTQTEAAAQAAINTASVKQSAAQALIPGVK